MFSLHEKLKLQLDLPFGSSLFINLDIVCQDSTVHSRLIIQSDVNKFVESVLHDIRDK